MTPEQNADILHEMLIILTFMAMTLPFMPGLPHEHRVKLKIWHKLLLSIASGAGFLLLFVAIRYACYIISRPF